MLHFHRTIRTERSIALAAVGWGLASFLAWCFAWRLNTWSSNDDAALTMLALVALLFSAALRAAHSLLDQSDHFESGIGTGRADGRANDCSPLETTQNDMNMDDHNRDGRNLDDGSLDGRALSRELTWLGAWAGLLNTLGVISVIAPNLLSLLPAVAVTALVEALISSAIGRRDLRQTRIAQAVDGESVAGKPVAGKPVAGEPVEGRPVAGEPVAGEPVRPKPASAQAATWKPATGSPATALPATALPATGLPATGLPATGLPATGLPATGLPATGLPATGLPATGLPATGLPATGLPATALPINDSSDCLRNSIETCSVEGERILSGWVRFELAAEQKSAHVVIGFSPTFLAVPEIELDEEGDEAASEADADTVNADEIGEASDGVGVTAFAFSDCEAQIEHATPAGMRVVIKRRSAALPYRGKLHWHAEPTQVPATPTELLGQLP